MSGVEVLSRTQRIIVLPNTSTSIVKEGPTGPTGPAGLPGARGFDGVPGVGMMAGRIWAQATEPAVPEGGHRLGDVWIKNA